MDIGNILSGVTKGFKYIKETIDIAVRGLHTGNVQMEQDGLHVLNIWSKEFESVGATAGISILFSGGDPFKESRKAAQELKEKYPKK